MKAEFYSDSAGKFRWRYIADNGKIIADSSEGYENREDCEQGFKLFQETAKDAEIEGGEIDA